MANCNRDPKKGRPFKPSDFNPYSAKAAAGSRVAANRVNLMALKPAFLAMKNKKSATEFTENTEIFS
jgi:hypothetical protein